MAKEGEHYDFDDLVLPDAPLDLDGPIPAAIEADSGEMLAPVLRPPPTETAAVDKQQQEEQYAKELRGADLRADQSETGRSERRQRSKSGFWETLSQADLYTVMLGAALLAVAIAVLCLLRELGSYGFDIKAKEGKATSQKVSWAVQSARPTTMPPAWPIAV